MIASEDLANIVTYPQSIFRFGLGLYSFGVANMNHNMSKLSLAALGYSQPDKKSQSGNLIDNHCCC